MIVSCTSCDLTLVLQLIVAISLTFIVAALSTPVHLQDGLIHLASPAVGEVTGHESAVPCLNALKERQEEQNTCFMSSIQLEGRRKVSRFKRKLQE